MTLAHRTENGVDIVTLPKQLGMASAADARTALKAIITKGAGRLVIDLGETEVIDSSGLAVLVSGLQAARKQGGDIYLANVGVTVRALFELTRLHTVFQMFDSESAALNAWRQA